MAAGRGSDTDTLGRRAPRASTELQRLEAQRTLAVQLSEAQGLQETLERGLDGAIEVTGADCGGVYLVDVDSGALSLQAHRGLSPDFVRAAGRFGRDTRQAGLVAAGQALFVNYSQVPTPADDPGKLAGVQAFALMPVRAGGRSVACLNVASRTEPQFDPATKQTLELVARLIGATLDRERAHATLRASEDRFRQLFTRSLDGIVHADLSGRITDCNEAYQAMLGYTTAELSELTYPEFTPERWHEPERVSVQRLMETGASGVYEKEYIRKDGTVFPVELSAWLVRDAAGTPTGMWGVARDLTERKAALERITSHSELLERQVSERTAALTRANVELEEQNSELERFTYTVSHDLKNPLITIKGFLGMVRDSVEAGRTDGVLADLAYIDGAADEMFRLLDELLELSRIGRVVNPPRSIPLGELVEEAWGRLAGVRAQRPAQLQVPAALPSVWGDRVRLGEVVENLLSNALKHRADQQAPVVEVGVRAAPKTGDTDETDETPAVYVRDNGVGVEPRYHDKIFGLFEQLDPSVEGTGVGLAIVKRIVEFHGGRVWVESTGVAGEGSTFLFTLAPPPASVANREAAQ